MCASLKGFNVMSAPENAEKGKSSSDSERKEGKLNNAKNEIPGAKWRPLNLGSLDGRNARH